MERVKEDLDIADIQQELTRENYKEKFHKLLCWEEKEHIDILERRLEFFIEELVRIDASYAQKEVMKHHKGCLCPVYYSLCPL